MKISFERFSVLEFIGDLSNYLDDRLARRAFFSSVQAECAKFDKLSRAVVPGDSRF
jgi:hypothetical protein